MSALRLTPLLLLALVTAISSPAQSGEEPYLVQEQDTLAVVVMGPDPPLEYDVLVLPDGTISLPIAGRVRCEGKTLEALEDQLTARFGKRLLDPEVSVRVVLPRSQSVYTLGSGILSQAVPLQPHWRVSNLIAYSGGILGSAQMLKATLRRLNGQVLPVNLPAVLSGTEPSADFLLEEGDVLTVDDPTAAGVLVAGAVASPGPVLLTSGRGAAQAIAQAQGVLPGADESRVLIVRADRSEITVDLRSALADQDMAKDVPVGPGDLIVVPWARKATSGVTVSGQVLRPCFIPLAGQDVLTLGAAILGPAGGLGPTADREQIALLRPTEEASSRVTGAPDSLWNEALRPGDVVYVPRRAEDHAADSSPGAE